MLWLCVLGNVLKSTSRYVESLTLFQDILFVLGGKISAFHPTFPIISLYFACPFTAQIRQSLVKCITVNSL